MIEKKELENAIKQYEAMLFDLEASVEAMKKKVEYARSRLSELPAEAVPEEVKEVVEAVK